MTVSHQHRCPGYPVGGPATGQTNKMKTLKELIEAQRCRKGKSAGTTKQGAFWLVCAPIWIRSFGENGIGNNAPDYRNYLQLRHYRSGEIKAVVNSRAWHQNHGEENSYRSVPPILDCTTIEDVIVVLKDSFDAYSDSFETELVASLSGLGMVESAPAPDSAPEERVSI